MHFAAVTGSRICTLYTCVPIPALTARSPQNCMPAHTQLFSDFSFVMELCKFQWLYSFQIVSSALPILKKKAPDQQKFYVLHYFRTKCYVQCTVYVWPGIFCGYNLLSVEWFQIHNSFLVSCRLKICLM